MFTRLYLLGMGLSVREVNVLNGKSEALLEGEASVCFGKTETFLNASSRRQSDFFYKKNIRTKNLIK